MINNSEYITKKCKCNNPQWSVLHTYTIKSGKRCGDKKYLVRCDSCGATWYTFKNINQKENKNEDSR